MLHMVDSKIRETVSSVGPGSINGANGAGGNNISSSEGNTELKGETVGENVKEKELALRNILKEILPKKSEEAIENAAKKMLEGAEQKTLEKELKGILGENEVKILKGKGILKKLGEVKTPEAQEESVKRYLNTETNKTDGKIFDEITSKNYIGQAERKGTEKGGNVSNIFKDIEGLNIEGLNIDALSPEEVAKKSEAFVNVLSDSLNSSLKNLKDIFNGIKLEYKTIYKDHEGKEISEEKAKKLSKEEVNEEKIVADTPENKKLAKEVAKFAKLTGKLAQSFGRMVPGATMGSLNGTDNIKAAKEIASELKEISGACDEFSKGIVGKKKDDIIKSYDILKLTNNLDEMKNFAKNSFVIKKDNQGMLAAQNFSSDMKIIQFDATIIDLMEDLDKEYRKYDVELKNYDNSAEGLKKDVQDTFAKLGLLLNGEVKESETDTYVVDGSNLEPGFKKARETREFMEKVRKSSMFSEFKYQDLNANLAGKLKEFGFKGENILKNIENKFKGIFGEKDGKPIYPRGGFRGRNGNLFNFAYTEKYGPYTKEVYDKLVEDEQQKTFFSEAQELGALDHKYQTNITASWNAVDDVLISILNDLNKPEGILSGEKMPDNRNVENLREAILDTDVGNGQKLGDLVDCKGGVYASKKTLADIMNKNGLRTICSVSGTTTDIVVGLVGIYGKKAMGKILEPFAKLVGEACKDVKPDNEEAIGNAVSELKNKLEKNYNGFKRLFSSIASYMQCGQYHSAGEVLGGLYTASLNFIDDTKDGPRTNIDTFKTNFDVLCKVLAGNPGAFALAAEE